MCNDFNGHKISFGGSHINAHTNEKNQNHRYFAIIPSKNNNFKFKNDYFLVRKLENYV
jgi:hypothetical protein